MTRAPFQFGQVTGEDRQRFVSTPPYTLAEVIRARADDMHVGMRYQDEQWTYAEMVAAATNRAGLLLQMQQPGPFHVGILLENLPEANLWFAATALAGATIVPLNLTRRGAELASDIAMTDCQVLVTEARHLDHLGQETPIARERIIDLTAADYALRIAAAAGTPLPASDPDPLDTSLLGFTSGSTAGPKACIFTHRRLVARARVMVQILGLTADDAIYEVMPLFHNTGVAMCWLPGWVAGSTHVMRPKFSASAFLPDVRRYGVTFFAYVGKVLSYILATSEGDDDTDNGLLRAMGVEGSAPDVARFAERFDCAVRDAYGATEGGITVHRTPDMPAGALGRPVSNTTRIVNPDSGRECAVAELDVRGRLLNPDEAIGEMVERADVASFEGYYNNDAANAERIRDGLYWSGDLAYRDQDGLYWFAGRGADMIRVDGENLGTAPIEAILDRYPGVVASAAYATPAVNGSDDLMVCLELVGDVAQRGFDPADFRAFLDAQPDLSPKMVPRFVRVTESMPMTGTSKIDRRTLRAERWATDEPIWWRPERSDTFVALTADDASALAAEVVRRGRDWGVTPSQTAQEARR